MLREPFSSRYNTRFAPGAGTSKVITAQFINRFTRLLEDYWVHDKLSRPDYLRRVLKGVRGLPLDDTNGEISYRSETVLLAEDLADTEWDFVFDFVERILDELEQPAGAGFLAVREEFHNDINMLFRTERMLYIITEGKVCPQRPDELEALESNVLSIASQQSVGDAVVKHLEKARNLLCQRPQPDFENTIKELVCALESTAKALSGDDDMKFGDFLKKGPWAKSIHGTLRVLMDKFHGYASNEGGIRHGAGEEVPTLTLDDVTFAYYQALSAIELLSAKCNPCTATPAEEDDNA